MDQRLDQHIATEWLREDHAQWSLVSSGRHRVSPARASFHRSGFYAKESGIEWMNRPQVVSGPMSTPVQQPCSNENEIRVSSEVETELRHLGAPHSLQSFEIFVNDIPGDTAFFATRFPACS